MKDENETGFNGRTPVGFYHVTEEGGWQDMGRSTCVNAPTKTMQDVDDFQQLNNCIDEWGFEYSDFDVRLLVPFKPSGSSSLRTHLLENIGCRRFPDEETRSTPCLLYGDSSNDRNEPVP